MFVIYALILIVFALGSQIPKVWGDKAELRRFKDGTIAESTGEAFIMLLLATVNEVLFLLDDFHAFFLKIFGLDQVSR
jgi:hypothetical protein